jgi:hypothetical protein
MPTCARVEAMPVRNEASLRRLTEIGIDVYLLRGAAAAPMSQPAASSAAESEPAAGAPAAAIVVLADERAPRAARVLADVGRAFGLARLRCTFLSAPSEAALAGADALVAFGESRARAAGACLPAQRQGEIGWVVVGEPAALAGNASAKRALWSELKRVMRSLPAAGHARGR